MPPYTYDDHGRRVAAQPKGERREQEILDEAERQIREAGPDAVTVGSIAAAVGITRAAVYFYFRSKNDVLAALVQRVVEELDTAVATSDAAHGTSAAAAITSALRRTEDLWHRHSAVMRAAVELTPTVPVIADLWVGARGAVASSVTAILVRAGTSDTVPLDDVVHALVGMTERSFSEASTDPDSLHRVAATLELIWRRALRLDDGSVDPRPRENP